MALMYRGDTCPMQNAQGPWTELKRSGALLVRSSSTDKDAADVVCALVAQQAHFSAAAGTPFVLVSQDGAFVAMARELRNQGRRIQVYRHGVKRGSKKAPPTGRARVAKRAKHHNKQSKHRRDPLTHGPLSIGEWCRGLLAMVRDTRDMQEVQTRS